MQEIWKPVIDRQNYQISNLGRVKGPKKILTPHPSPNGYLLVCLSNPNSSTRNETRYIHRLIAESFIPNDNPFLKDIVNHKDGNILNNEIDNLEWVSRSENGFYSGFNRVSIEGGFSYLIDKLKNLDENERNSLKNMFINQLLLIK